MVSTISRQGEQQIMPIEAAIGGADDFIIDWHWHMTENSAENSATDHDK